MRKFCMWLLSKAFPVRPLEEVDIDFRDEDVIPGAVYIQALIKSNERK